MKARIVGVYEESDYYVFTVQLNEFKEYNKAFEEKTWYDNKMVPCLGWSETPYYPEDGRFDVWTGINEDVKDYFVLSDVSPVYKRYQQSGSPLSYTKWLEKELEQYYASDLT
jgi:hypothetical protein